MSNHENLVVWRKAHAFAVEVFRACRTLPPQDTYAFKDQLRRASISIGSNIAEGCSRDTDGAFKAHLITALGSANEVHSLVTVARDVDALSPAVADPLLAQVEEIRRMLGGLLGTVRRRIRGNAAKPAPQRRTPRPAETKGE